MSGKAFLDTNILLYCFDNADSRKLMALKL